MMTIAHRVKWDGEIRQSGKAFPEGEETPIGRISHRRVPDAEGQFPFDIPKCGFRRATCVKKPKLLEVLAQQSPYIHIPI
jgi:hypothetical protein